MSEYPLPQPGERPVPLDQLKQNWPDKVKPFIAHFTEADFPGGVRTVEVPEGERVIGGLTKGSIAAYDSEGRMVADWETFWNDDKSRPTRRWEAVHDSSGRKVAERIVSGSTVGKFDGTTTTVYVFEYDKSGRERNCIQYTQHPNGQYEHDEGWSKADTTVDGKPAWEVDNYTPFK